MKKIYLEIGSSISMVLALIITIVVLDTVLPQYAPFGNTAALLLFVIVMGIIGIKLAEIKD